jgi:hypothetical protein
VWKKIDLDKTYFVKIENPLRRYIDEFVRMRTRAKYSHKFWVRGHFRHLKADRYHEKKTLWIVPFIKGQGILIQKNYDVEKGKEI